MRRRDFFNGLHGAIAALASTRFVLPIFAAPQIASPLKGSSVHFTLTAADGSSITEKSYRDKWLAVYFGYTFCPDVCPTTMVELADVLKSLGGRADSVQVVFITVDPQRDKPEVLADYLKSFDPRFVGLTGTSAQISAAAKSFNVFYERNDADDGTYTYDHSSYIYLVEPDGKLADALTSDSGSKEIATALMALMSRAR